MSAYALAAVRTGLTQTTSVTSIVPAARIYTSYRDSATLPCIVLTPRNDSAISPSFGRTDQLRRLVIDIDCISTSLKLSRVLAEAVRVKMHGTGGTANTTDIVEIREKGVTSTYDVGAEASETGVHVTTVTVEATYTASAVSPIIITTPGGET